MRRNRRDFKWSCCWFCVFQPINYKICTFYVTTNLFPKDSILLIFTSYLAAIHLIPFNLGCYKVLKTCFGSITGNLLLPLRGQYTPSDRPVGWSHSFGNPPFPKLTIRHSHPLKPGLCGCECNTLNAFQEKLSIIPVFKQYHVSPFPWWFSPVWPFGTAINTVSDWAYPGPDIFSCQIILSTHGNNILCMERIGNSTCSSVQACSKIQN